MDVRGDLDDLQGCRGQVDAGGTGTNGRERDGQAAYQEKDDSPPGEYSMHALKDVAGSTATGHHGSTIPNSPTELWKCWSLVASKMAAVSTWWVEKP